MEIQVPLKFLKLGEEEGINARVAGRDEDIDALAANLHIKGQIENLVVKKFDDTFYSVSNGNRRLRAFQKIHGANSDFPINCTLREVDRAGAFEDSMTTAITARQLHPVDQYEAFARLRDADQTEEEIARKFGLSQKEVRQALALGHLSPKILDAWRNGDIKAEVAQAFTLTLDRKTQEKAFSKLTARAGRIDEDDVRQELCGDDDNDGVMVNFVGIAAYEQRGGKVTEDLFKERHFVSDGALLREMVREGLQARCEQLVADGWKWASIDDDLPTSWRTWSVTRVNVDKVLTPEEVAKVEKIKMRLDELEEDFAYGEEVDQLNDRLDMIKQQAKPRAFSAKQRAKLGCVVGLDSNSGNLIVTYAVERPAVSSAKASAAAAPTAGEPPSVREKPKAKGDAPEEVAISNALKHSLSVQLTRAAALALSQDVELSLVVLLTAMTSHDHVLRAHVSGLTAATLDLTGAEEIADNLELFGRMKPAERMQMLAQVAAATLNFENADLSSDDKFGNHGDVRAICAAIDPKALNAALRGEFNAADYFERAPKAVSLIAIGEAIGSDASRKIANSPKADIVKFAVENVPSTGWLPPQMRAAGYDGPPVKKGTAPNRPAKGAKKAAAKKPATKKAKAKTAAKKKSKR